MDTFSKIITTNGKITQIHYKDRDHACIEDTNTVINIYVNSQVSMLVVAMKLILEHLLPNMC